MMSPRELFARICAQFRRRALDDDFDQEYESHLMMLLEDYRRGGIPDEEARHAARLKLGGLTQIRDRHRDIRGLPFLETLFQDVRHAIRGLWKNPGFAAVLVTTLALGIGANAAIFTVLNGIVLRQLPVPRPGELVILDCLSLHGGRGSFSHADFQWIRERNHVFNAVSASASWRLAWLRNGETRQLNAAVVSGDYFSMLSVTPAIGRVLAPEDDHPGNASAVVISH